MLAFFGDYSFNSNHPLLIGFIYLRIRVMWIYLLNRKKIIVLMGNDKNLKKVL